MRLAFALLALAADVTTTPVVAQTPRWGTESAQELLDAIRDARAEGLDPRDYDPEPLRDALREGPGPQLDALASQRFHLLARDYAQGHVGPQDRLSWFIAGPELTTEAADALMTRALAEQGVGATLRGQLPTDDRYVRLRTALAATRSDDSARLLAIRVNMERWRWLPRRLGGRRIEVNVPSYRLTYLTDGQIAASHRVVVGKPSTPTPQFGAAATSLILNPWWEIPQSIVAESVGKLVRTRPAVARARGYVWNDGAYRQRPGANNALGRMKLVMPNPFSVYIHDTPAQALFAQPMRALSHGCIRTESALDLAATLLAGLSAWQRTDIDRAVSSGSTWKVALPAPVPVYVFYFTAEADATGKLLTYPDLYDRDRVVAAEMLDRGALDYVG